VLGTVHYIADCGCRCQSGLDESRWKHRRIQHNDQSPRCHDCVILMNSTQIRLGFSNENNNHHRSMHLLLHSYITTAQGSQQLHHPSPLASMVPHGGFLRPPPTRLRISRTHQIADPLDHTAATIHPTCSGYWSQQIQRFHLQRLRQANMIFRYSCDNGLWLHAGNTRR
jgi:hypothetical protein